MDSNSFSTCGIGIVFVIPHIVLIIYYSFMYDYNLPVILDSCKDDRTSYLYVANVFYSIKYPFINLIINHLIRLFVDGFVIGLTVMTLILFA